MYSEPLFFIADFGVSLYRLFFALGAGLALLLAFHLAREQGIPSSDVMPIWIICIAAAVLGGSALSVILNEVFDVFSLGISATQWIVAVTLVLSLYLWLLPWARGKILQVMDIVFPPLALAMAVGRLGCFSAGCCYGKPAEGLPWAVIFPPSHPSAGIPVHPTQLYESAGMLIILGILLGLRKVPAFKGALIWVFLLTYGLLRFVIEFYRGHPRPMVGFLSLNQVVCIVFVAVGAFFLLRGSPGKKDE